MTTFATARYDAVREVNYAAITGAFEPLGTPVAHVVRLLHIINTTNAGIFLSFDGITENAYCPATSFFLHDLATNSLALQANTQIYIEYETAPTTGNVYVMVVFARGQ